ncbi:CopD family protein [Pseudochryseolinea flava]|uniref:Protoporphyrinogen IX oxidase n=1 Tax=Pseudochryseolinea flava TaxID=2059302 RepID=A0A364Y0B0_9BACT|nr:CopD family protein [Pseudochryseolinea flava]RAV99342.1 protoporphyrinogen IX oxidase [Pseudochryseolinea flava]
MHYYYLKAVHIIFIVAWFAGLFYMPRLFIYTIEANDKPAQEKAAIQNQLIIMASRLLFGITWPAGVITFLIGVLLVWNNPGVLREGYMHFKLFFVFLLYGYHFSLHAIFNQLKKGVYRYSSQQIRIWNEVPTLLLISIVFLIVVKSSLSMVWGVLGLIAVSVAIMAGIRVYKNLRK